MAFRDLPVPRQPQPAKRMLLFFNIDETTSIVETNKIKKILSGKLLAEGASVLVQFGKDEFEACVLKLHNDPSVLRQAETEFLSQTISEDASDKENELPAPKRKKMGSDGGSTSTNKDRGQPKPTTTKKKKTKESDNSKPSKEQNVPKQPKIKKPKQIITIEAEELPRNVPKNSKKLEENKPGSLSFLDPQEQERVKQLLSAYKKEEAKEVSTQTEMQESGIEVGVQKDGYESHMCNCQDVLSARMETLERNVHRILSIAEKLNPTEQVPEHELFNCSDFSYIEESDCFPTIAEVTGSVCLDQTLPGMDTSTTVTVQEVNTSSASCDSQLPSNVTTSQVLSQRAMPSGIFDEMFAKSTSVSNYAKNLVFATFLKEDLLGANCSGAFMKQSLEKDPRLDIIKEMTFKKYNVEDRKKSWASCRKAIDGAIRKLRLQAKA